LFEIAKNFNEEKIDELTADVRKNYADSTEDL
jgi:hypothetical protein